MLQEKEIQLIELPRDYIPSEEEEYMSEQQLEYFQRRLQQWKEELQQEALYASTMMQNNDWRQADEIDRASIESDAALELRATERARKLIKRIDEALTRIRDGSFGYCDETGEEIGLGRLMARPIATLSIEAKERQERIEMQHRHF